MIKVRQHWIALVRPNIIVSVLLGLILIWLATSPSMLDAFRHIAAQTPYFFTPIFERIDAYNPLIATAPFFIAGAFALGAWSQWLFTFFQIDEYGLTYQLGPFFQNTIPLRAIQDIRKSTTPFGLLFGYGTLIVDAGREQEVLRFVPNVAEFAAALRR